MYRRNEGRSAKVCIKLKLNRPAPIKFKVTVNDIGYTATGESCTSYILIPYITNRSRWKSFAVTELNCNSLEYTYSWTVVLHGQGLLHRLFHWKSFTVTNRSTKTM